jgi:hypothetical protein
MSRAKIVIMSVLGFLVFLALITYAMMGGRQTKVEVCMAFQGRTNCATASAASREEAIRTATTTACALIASGVTDSMGCDRTQPTSIRMLQ